MTVLIKRTVTYLTMTSGEDIILGSWLAARQPLAPRVVITIATGAVLGAKNSSAALHIDDLTNYNSVTIDNFGEIQGKGGVSSGARGGNAISITGGNVIFNNKGAIRAGGGAGSPGGRGAWGNWITGWGPQKWRIDTNKSGWYRYSAGCDDYRAYYDDASIGYVCMQPYILNGSYMYTYGAAGPDPFGAFNYIKRSTVADGSGGAGGAGGRGRGYNQTRTNGAYGAYGTNYGGRGGRGGQGGWWGNNGGYGLQGDTGTYFKKGAGASFGGTRYSRATSNAPVHTPAIALSGYSLIATGNGAITFTNTGTLNGPTSGI